MSAKPASTEGSAEHSTIASKRAGRREVGRLAHVAVDELDPGLAQPRQVELGAAPHQVVERDDLPVGMALGERDAEVAADEAGAAGDQDAHRLSAADHQELLAEQPPGERRAQVERGSVRGEGGRMPRNE